MTAFAPQFDDTSPGARPSAPMAGTPQGAPGDSTRSVAMQNTVSEDAINAHSRSLLTIIVPQPHGLGMNLGEELTPVSGTGTPNMSFSSPRGPQPGNTLPKG